jgi:hypothetical protein
MLLQHFFIGLNRKTRKFINLASRGVFMHITAERAKTILMNILNDLPKEKLLEEKEISIAEPKLKPLPSGLKYAFLNNDQDSSVIISDKLSQEESLRLIIVLKKHHAAFSYSLHDLKGISHVLCTHRIPTDPEITPSREPQRRLNNAMRDVVKKEVLKLLHV